MIRLNRFLAMTGLASRRKSDQLIEDGLIKVNGKVCTTMGKIIDEKKDIVEYKGRVLKIKKENIYILLNKPRGCITTVKDEKNRRTVMDLLTIEERVYPVGRLDYDSEGLILMTNDGDLTYRLTHPCFEIKKVYRVLIDGLIETNNLNRFRSGIMLDGRKTKPCQAKIIKVINDCHYIEVKLHEGRNRQIRRMFEKMDYKVLRLRRVEYAGLNLGNLRTGEWRKLNHQEVSKLKQLLKR